MREYFWLMKGWQAARWVLLMTAAVDLDIGAAEGVEVDDFSRFIDHTLATDWEVLCNDIENALKSWTAAPDSSACTGDKLLNLTYRGIKLTLGLYGDGCLAEEISTWFGCSRALVMSRATDDWPDTLTPSITKTIFSALVCSLSSSGARGIPVFITPTFIDEIFAAKELYGYRIAAAGDGAALPCTHLYSYLVEQADGAADARYLDGLKQTFWHHASQLLGPVSQGPSHAPLLFSLKETYRYRHSGLPACTPHSPDQAALVAARECWEDAFPRRLGARSALAALTVALRYPRLAEHSFMDNAQFTTLIPSKQPSDSWSVVASFRSEASLPLARCVKNMIAFFAVGCCPGPAPEQAACYAELLADLPSPAKGALLAFLVQKEPASAPAAEDYESLLALIKSNGSLQASGGDSFAGTAPAGSFSSLLALFAGTLDCADSVAALWRRCTLDFRSGWDSGAAAPALAVPAAAEGGTGERERPLLLRSLWADVIEAKRLLGVRIALPDPSSALLCQKIDMMHFCLATRDEEPVCRAVGGGSGDVVPPPLLRRLPQTTDAIAQSRRLLEKLSSGQSKSARDNPLLMWQIQQPELISDIRAFKAANPSRAREDFEEWYFGGRPPSGLEQCLRHWDCVEPAAAPSQRPLFHCEGEAEKVLGFFEKYSAANLSADLLCICLSTTFQLLRLDVDGALDSCNDEGTLSDAYGKLGAVRGLVVSAIGSIQKCQGAASADHAGSMADARGAASCSYRAAAALEELELFALRLRGLTAAFQAEHKPWRLLAALARCAEACAADSAEARALQALAERASCGAAHDAWHSRDARELGRPTTREVSAQLGTGGEVSMHALVGAQTVRVSFWHEGES